MTLQIGSEGGELILNDDIHLYVPAGTVALPTTFELEELFLPMPPPEGFMQVGRAFSARPGDVEIGGPVALSVVLEYFQLLDWLWEYVRLGRLNASGQWEMIPGFGSVVPSDLGVTVSELGSFAAFIDTSQGAPDEVMAEISLRVSYGQDPAVPGRTWQTHASAKFWNFDQTQELTDTGGPVRVGDFDLGPGGNYCYYQSFAHEVDPGASLAVRLAGSEVIPTLNDYLQFFAEDLVITNPSDPNTIVNRREPYTITWSGTGPQLIWLIVYGTGLDGSFVYQGQMTPNTGEFVITPEELSAFEENGSVTIFLQRYQARTLTAEGFHRSSNLMVESISSMKITIP